MKGRKKERGLTLTTFDVTPKKKKRGAEKIIPNEKRGERGGNRYNLSF